MSKSVGSNLIIAFCGPLSGFYTGQRASLLASIDAVPIRDALLLNTGGSGIKWYKLAIFSFLAAFKLFSYLLTQKVDILYITPSRSLLGAMRDLPIVLICRLMHMRIIAHWHGAEFIYLKNLPSSPSALLLKLMWISSEHIALCDTMRSDLYEFGFKKVTVIHNFHDINEAKISKKIGSDSVIKLLYLSNLLPEKGIEAALLAHQKLRYSFNVELHVVGARLMKLSSSIEDGLVGDGVIYHGPLYAEHKTRILSACDIFLFPSTYRTEAFPLVVLEAMGAGLAIVAYDHNYIKDFFNFDGGLLVPPDPEMLSEAISKLILHPDLLSHFKKSNKIFSADFSKNNYQARVRDKIYSFRGCQLDK